MTEVVRTVEIPAEPADVWAVLADFGAISGWAANVDHSCLLSEHAEGVGVVRRIQTGRTTVVERIVSWDAPWRLSYELEGLPPVVRSASNTWQIEAVGAGARVSLTSRIDTGPRPPQKLIAKAVGRKMAQASEEMLVGLKARVS